MENKILCSEYSGESIGGVVNCGDFMVSLLNFLPRLVPEKTESMQKHTETDECFILLSGRAMLYTADGADAPENISARTLEYGKIYTVPRELWHAPVLSRDAKVLLVEKNNTAAENSPRKMLSDEQKKAVRMLGQGFADKGI